MSLPPDLRVLCRKLTATPPADLPALCPVLVNHVLRCGGPLSASSEQATKANASEAMVLVHKLKTQVNVLLHGKTAKGRFVGMVLAKAIIDVGGWECLRTSEHWVRGLLSLLQKPDPSSSKELCLVVLARIYTLLQPYPTLARQIATPTVPTFATACLQLLRTEAPGKPPKAPMSVVEAVTRALAALVPLYPTTFRPFAVQVRNAVRVFLAPTASDGLVVPQSLMQSSRHLVVLLHYTTPKIGNAEEWAKLLNSLIHEAHVTADQVFRAIRESRDPASGHVPGQVSREGEPRGGGDGPDDFPPWVGLQSGAERLTGLFGVIAECFRCPTKTPVAVPLGEVSSLISRMSLVLPPAPGVPTRHNASLVNPGGDRDETEELWSVLVDIHGATLELLVSVEQRMGAHMLPLIPDTLEDAVRMFVAGRHVPRIRETAFSLVQDLLPLVGPSLSRQAVDNLRAVVHACCQDLLEASGHAQQEKKDATPVKNGPNGLKNKLSSANADLFLKPGSGSTASDAPAASTVQLAASHLQVAESLLAAFLLHLPQQHVKKADRALMDRTAILGVSKRAMVSSVLHPYVDRSGRHIANIIPFLAHAYPHDIDMEVLRSNLRTAPHCYGSNIFAAAVPGAEAGGGDSEDEDEDEDEDQPMPDRDTVYARETRGAVPLTSSGGVFGTAGEDDTAFNGTDGGFALPAAVVAESRKPAADFEPLTLKRKPDTVDGLSSAPKRLDTGKPAAAQASAVPADGNGGDSDGDSDSDGNEELNFEFESDEGGNDDEESADNS